MIHRSLIYSALVVAFAIAPSGLASARAAETLPGPVPAKVLRVIDGDTLAVRARIWIGQVVAVHVRLAGIDAPEMHARCAHERVLAVEARDALARRAAVGSTVELVDVRNGKYGGRVIARVLGAGGANLGAALITAGLARPYHGHARQPWCRRRAAR